MISPEIQKIVELTRYAPISEQGRIEVAVKIDAIYSESGKKQLLTEKLRWYKKLRMKLDRILDEELSVQDYRDEVEKGIWDLETELDFQDPEKQK
jgi:hypothetical protein